MEVPTTKLSDKPLSEKKFTTYIDTLTTLPQVTDLVIDSHLHYIWATIDSLPSEINTPVLPTPIDGYVETIYPEDDGSEVTVWIRISEWVEKNSLHPHNLDLLCSLQQELELISHFEQVELDSESVHFTIQSLSDLEYIDNLGDFYPIHIHGATQQEDSIKVAVGIRETSMKDDELLDEIRFFNHSKLSNYQRAVVDSTVFTLPDGSEDVLSMIQVPSDRDELLESGEPVSIGDYTFTAVERSVVEEELKQSEFSSVLSGLVCDDTIYIATEYQKMRDEVKQTEIESLHTEIDSTEDIFSFHTSIPPLETYYLSQVGDLENLVISRL